MEGAITVGRHRENVGEPNRSHCRPSTCCERVPGPGPCETLKAGRQHAPAARWWRGSCSRRSARTAASLHAGVAVLMFVHGAAALVQDNLKPNRQAGMVVGDRGFICATLNGGYTWQEEQLQDGSRVDLYDVFVLDDFSAVAVGGDCNQNYRSSSCGIFLRPAVTSAPGSPMVTWTKSPLGNRQGAEAMRKILAVTFCNATLGLVVGEVGSIIRTLDAGKTWEVIASGALCRTSNF